MSAEARRPRSFPVAATPSNMVTSVCCASKPSCSPEYSPRHAGEPRAAEAERRALVIWSLFSRRCYVPFGTGPPVPPSRRRGRSAVSARLRAQPTCVFTGSAVERRVRSRRLMNANVPAAATVQRAGRAACVVPDHASRPAPPQAFTPAPPPPQQVPVQGLVGQLGCCRLPRPPASRPSPFSPSSPPSTLHPAAPVGAMGSMLGLTAAISTPLPCLPSRVGEQGSGIAGRRGKRADACCRCLMRLAQEKQMTHGNGYFSYSERAAPTHTLTENTGGKESDEMPSLCRSGRCAAVAETYMPLKHIVTVCVRQPGSCRSAQGTHCARVGVLHQSSQHGLLCPFLY
ncbi:hypothetical protein AOLI_G00315070 [Acnodon oligacanthus]